MAANGRKLDGRPQVSRFRGGPGRDRDDGDGQYVRCHERVKVRGGSPDGRVRKEH